MWISVTRNYLFTLKTSRNVSKHWCVKTANSAHFLLVAQVFPPKFEDGGEFPALCTAFAVIVGWILIPNSRTTPYEVWSVLLTSIPFGGVYYAPRMSGLIHWAYELSTNSLFPTGLHDPQITLLCCILDLLIKDRREVLLRQPLFW